jgi:tetratricopeptide (TPR) repeat protein
MFFDIIEFNFTIRPMKNLFCFICLFTSVILISSCSSPRDKEIKAISTLEKELEKDAARPDPKKLTQLLDAYIAFVDKNAADTAAPNYLYKAITLCIGVNNGQKSMELIDRTLNDFPKSKYVATTLFLKAYVYENMLGNYGQATTFYKSFLKKFPTHDLADDAEAALKNMGKSPEEMVKEFEAARAAGQAKKGN